MSPLSEGMRIGGYAAKYGPLSENLGGFFERIDPGFFRKSEASGWEDVSSTYNHEDNLLLGTIRAGTLRLNSDRVGLAYEVDVPAFRGDVYELVQRGDLWGSSFRFRATEDDWTLTSGGQPLRTLVAGLLFELGPVNTPAYKDTSAGLRSLAKKFDADPLQVAHMAREGTLRKFFTRTPDHTGVNRSRVALARAMALKEV